MSPSGRPPRVRRRLRLRRGWSPSARGAACGASGSGRLPPRPGRPPGRSLSWRGPRERDRPEEDRPEERSERASRSEDAVRPAGAPTRGAAAGALAGLAEVLDLARPPGPHGSGRPGQPARGRGRDVQLGEEVLGGGVGLLRVGDAEVERLVDQAPARHVVPVDEGDGDTGVARAAGAADAVQVGLLVLGALVVDDVRDVLDVDAAGGDVGGDEDVDLAVAEGAQRLLAGALAQVAVDGGGGEAAVGQLVGDLGGGALGAAEDHGQAAALGLQDARQHLDLVHGVGAVDELLDGLDRVAVLLLGPWPGCGWAGSCSGGPARRPAPGMVAENSIVWRRGGGHRQQLLDVGQEAQVEHLVGLVEDDALDVRERSRWPCLARSISRPGVPTTISTPRCSASTCGS